MEKSEKSQKAQIKVFVTKTQEFRAKIKEPNGIPYEVTIGGKSWNEGTGNEHSERIFVKIRHLMEKLQNKWDHLICN